MRGDASLIRWSWCQLWGHSVNSHNEVLFLFPCLSLFKVQDGCRWNHMLYRDRNTCLKAIFFISTRAELGNFLLWRDTKVLLLMALIVNGTSEHGAHVGWKTGIFGNRFQINTTVDVKNRSNYLFYPTLAHRSLSYHLIHVPCYWYRINDISYWKVPWLPHTLTLPLCSNNSRARNTV